MIPNAALIHNNISIGKNMSLRVIYLKMLIPRHVAKTHVTKTHIVKTTYIGFTVQRYVTRD